MKRLIELFFKAGMPMIYGISWVLGSAGAFISLFVYLYKVFQAEREFQWIIPIAIIIFATVFSFTGYLLIKSCRTGIFEIKKILI